ncbi:hypothetical protein HRI_001287900 [Hibiscus trionum]|uniref:NAC domain-containing protein n=1 Tax=Hibiscus trionum TaxID=183268 RepID=A0A9W7HEZ5_HIBTR|nr:hypothetical protein HRI_001287900 [Hibiscus trionum]
MDLVKGFRFHPTDEELIEYLRIKTFDRDSLVQVIAEIQDICEFEPWELPGRSTLQTGDRPWYFMYPPKYKYRNSKLISRTTMEGYWKPTGNARKIINSETRSEIGSKKTLVFYKGQCNSKNKNKTSWVMHEYELNATTESDQKPFKLCKLKEKVDVSSSEVGQLDQDSLSILENHVANNAISEDILDPNRSSVHNRCSAVEIYAEGRSYQPNMINEDESSNVSSNFINHAAEDTILKVPLHLKELSTEQNGPKDDNRVPDSYSSIKQDDESCNSILTNYDETVTDERSNQHNIVGSAEGFEMPSNERSNQHNIVIAAEGIEWPSNLEYFAEEDIIPSELLYNDGLYNIISLDELLAAPEATNNSNWIQNQYITNKDHGELNSTFADKNEAYLQEVNTQQCSAADNEGFGLSCIGSMTELSNSMEKSRKRPRRI